MLFLYKIVENSRNIDCAEHKEINSLRWKRSNPDENDPAIFLQKKWGRPVLLGRELDDKIQAYLMKVREAGEAVSAWIAVTTAWGVLLTYNKTRLDKFWREYMSEYELHPA